MFSKSFNLIRNQFTDTTKLNLASQLIVERVNKKVIYEKVNAANNWYRRIIGLDQVSEAQRHVEEIEHKLYSVQDNRRELGRKLIDIRAQSFVIQDQLHKVKRQENLDLYLELVKQESEIMRREKEATEQFQHFDKEERDLFTAFTNAVRTSHEKQQAQVEYTKYIGIILSIIGSFLAFCYSALRKYEIKALLENSAVAKEPLLRQLQETERQLQSSREQLQTIESYLPRLLQLSAATQTDVQRLLQKEEREGWHFYGVGGVVNVAYAVANCLVRFVS